MILVVMGVCGCGKTTVGEALAKHLGWPFVEGDALHPEANRAKMSAGQALDDDDRWPWLDRIAETMARHHQDVDHGGGGLVVACSALARRYRERLARSGAPLLFLHLAGSPDLLAARMAERRDHFMPPSLLASQLETLEPPGEDEPAIRLDIAEPPETLVRRICAHLQAVQSDTDREENKKENRR